MRIGTVAIIGTFGWTCCDMVETRGDYVPGEYPLVAALLTGQRITLQLRERATDCAVMRMGQLGISTRQRLNADRLGRVEGRVPSSPPLSSSVGVADENFGGARPLAPKYR